MYKVDPGQARTDLYGQGKGSAQVIDQGYARKQLADKEEQKFRKGQAKTKAEDAREKEIYASLGDTGGVAIMQRDQGYFNEEQAKLRDFTVKNIKQLKSGDGAAWIKFHEMHGKLTQDAEMSKNAREYAERISGKQLDKMDQDEVEAFRDWRENGVADWDTAKYSVSPKVNYSERVMGKLKTYADKQAKHNVDGTTIFSKGEAFTVIENDIKADPILANNAMKEFSKATDEELAEFGLDRDNSTPIEYMQHKYAPMLEVNDAARARASRSGSNTANKNKVTIDMRSIKTDKSGYKRAKIWHRGSQMKEVTIKDPANPGRTIKVRPLEYKLSPDGSRVTVVASTSGGKLMEMGHEEARDLLFGQLEVLNPFDLFSNAEEQPNVKTVRNTKVKIKGF